FFFEAEDGIRAFHVTAVQTCALPICVDVLPPHGAEVTADGEQVGFVGSSVRHHELGPIALALVKRTVPVDAPLLAGGVAATQERSEERRVGKECTSPGAAEAGSVVTA